VRAGRTDGAAEPAPWFGARYEGLDEAQEASVGESLYRLIGSRWIVMVLRELEGGTMRYKALHRRLGPISHKMLTHSLRRLESAGMVRRRAHRSVPPSVDYELTTMGAQLLGNLAALERWARENGLPC
jgi:DNA-binding HxlR family transcriptional regulator